jgi:hypothetical protein
VSTVTQQTFRGIDTRGDAQEVPGAIDCLNVALDRPGTVRSRDGFASVTAVAVAAANAVLMPLVKAATNTTNPSYGVYLVVSIAGPTGQLIDGLTGSSVGGAGTARVPQQTSYTQFGTPSTDFLYIAGDSGARGATTTRGTLQKWDGTTLSNSVGKPFYVATTPWDNRLVQAGYDTTADPAGGVNGSQSTVFFSDAGVPDTFSANNFIRLHPGDGERITGACVWRDKLIVTKETRMFVFYGTSTDSTGNPVFNYRTVDLPYRVPENLSRAIVAGNDAFYLLTDRGVYASTGGPPQLISDPINRALVGPVPATWSDYTTVPTLLGMSYAAGRLWVHVLTSTTYRSFVLDTATGQWTYSSIGTHVLSNSDGSGVYFTGSGTDNQTAGTVYLTSLSATTDAGSAITSRYRFGFYDGGAPEQEKWLRQMMLSGTGTVNVKTAVNDATTLSAATSVAMGTSPAVSTGRWSAGTRGRDISVEISATSAWSLSHLSMDIGGIRAPGVRAA